MQKKNKNVRVLKGFTLVESLVLLFIFAIVSAIFFQVYFAGTRLIIESKNRLGATALANQKMEIVRSVDYDTIGTKHWNGSAWVYGIPAGDLLEDETVSVNTHSYNVYTFVQYVDDAFDGQTPSDTIPTDYKRVRITVSWGDEGADQQVVLFGNFSPNGIEASSGGGVLSINVLDATGSGVSGASVHIVNSAAGVDTTGMTDSTGNLTLPGAPAGTEAYVITVSKNSYFGASTFPSYPTTAYNPVDVHASVVANVLNQKTIVMDQDADITLQTEDPFGTAIPSISFSLNGGRVLGTDPSDSSLVYGFSQTGSTDSSGQESYTNESYGQYTFALGSGVTDYSFYKLSPEGTTNTIYDAAPGSTTTLHAVLLDKNIGSVKVEVTNQADGSPVSGASVQLSNATLVYDATVTTDQYGYAYFPEALPELTAGTYDLAVTASGYGSESDTVDVSGALQVANIQMTAN
ncbi:MAG: carboxypeptidase regulatory-like domain-containing protein [Patescibacteria group bacterium]